ncbi:MAG: hypothetical protein RL318_2499 [Fibrobacterota bacterium]
MDGKVALPSPVLPALPIGEGVGIGAGTGTTVSQTRTRPLHWSSERPLDLAERRWGIGAELRVASRGVQYWMEFATGSHHAGLDATMVTACAGHEIPLPGWSLMPWLGLGLGIHEADYTARDDYPCEDFGCDRTPKSDSALRADFLRIPLERRSESVNSGLLSLGVTLLAFRDSPASPYLAGRLLAGGKLGKDSEISVSNPVDISRWFVDAGVRVRAGVRWELLAGAGVNGYHEARIRGMDANLNAGIRCLLPGP